MNELQTQRAREKTREQVNAAVQAWEKAPLHVRAMAGAYVGPLLAALVSINDELGVDYGKAQ